MNNERYNQIVDEVYEKYINSLFYNFSGEVKGYLTHFHLTRVEFIFKCKTDAEFSEMWGLKIEERELSFEDRAKLLTIKIGHEIKETSLHGEGQFETEVTQDANAFNIPTKLLTVTYKNEIIVVYE